MTRLVRAELFKLRKRLMTKVLLGIVLGIVVLLYMLLFAISRVGAGHLGKDADTLQNRQFVHEGAPRALIHSASEPSPDAHGAAGGCHVRFGPGHRS